jgi:hypothetical protein
VLGREALGRSAERLSTSALGMGFWRGVTGHGRREEGKSADGSTVRRIRARNTVAVRAVLASNAWVFHFRGGKGSALGLMVG